MSVGRRGGGTGARRLRGPNGSGARRDRVLAERGGDEDVMVGERRWAWLRPLQAEAIVRVEGVLELRVVFAPGEGRRGWREGGRSSTVGGRPKTRSASLQSSKDGRA